LGISSRGGCLWSSDKDYRKLVPILAYCVTSDSGLALDFVYGLALDFVYLFSFRFGSGHMQLATDSGNVICCTEAATFTFVQFVLYQQLVLEYSKMFLALCTVLFAFFKNTS
jgi:hypothetical protein